MDNNILIVWDRMGDYHRARWSALKNAYTKGRVYAADLGAGDDLYGWKNTDHASDYFLLSPRHPNRFDMRRLFKFIKILSVRNISCVCLAGYGKPEYIFFILFAWISGKRVILFSESWYPSVKLIDFLKSYFLRLTCHGFLVSGQRAFDHFAHRLKINPAKIRIGYSVVDNDHFSVIGQTYNKGSEKILLCVARFAPEKNLPFLMQAFISSNMTRKGWQLAIIGGGPMQPALTILAEGQNIKLLPWQSYEQLPALYHEADVFILPSSFEPWGLVVNEAMAAGLPVILSSAVGCVPDLLVEGENGWGFNPFDSKALLKIFEKVAVAKQETLKKFSVLSRRRVKNYSPRLFAENVLELIKAGND